MPASEELSVWVLQGPKAGDNAQARELARRLGHPAILKPLSYNSLHHLPNILMGASIVHVRDAKFSPPWPRLVICTGKRAVPVALWIRQQSKGMTKIVHLGRPRVPLSWIDLIITTPQYGLPSGGNMIERAIPFAVPEVLQNEDLEIWRSRFRHLPKPWTGALVGGPAYPLAMDDQAISRLAARIDDVRGQGAVLVSTSPRTGVLAARRLSSLITAPVYMHFFGEGDNPHQAILALADRFIVTSDSMSMLAEVTETGKPFEVFELPRSRWAVSWVATRGLGGWLARHGLMSPPRDLRKAPRGPHVIDDRMIIERIEKLMRGT